MLAGLVFIANDKPKEAVMRKKERAAALNEQKNTFESFMKMLLRYFSVGWKWINKTFF